MQTVGVVLAAGGSRRMGRTKALLEVRPGLPLVRAHVDALARCCGRVVVVVGAVDAPVAAVLPEAVTCIANPDWESTGPVESLALALATTRGPRVVVTPVDVPPARPRDLVALLGATAPAVLAWQGRPGHPVVLDEDCVLRLLAGPVPGGLRTLLHGATSVAASTPDVLLNLNTPTDWARWRAEGE